MLSEKLLTLVLEQLDENKGEDIKVIDVKEKTSITDFMVIATGTSDRHVRSLAQNVVEEIKKHNFRPIGIEGENGGDWVLVDFGDIILHVMSDKTRAFYQLEKLWEVDFPIAHSSH